MYFCGYTLSTILEDALRRIHGGWVRRNRYSTFIYFAISIAFISVVASKAMKYWASYAPNESYSVADSYWFAYITLLTVGLGDLYVQPQGLFPVDVLAWAVIILYGIAALTAFLDRFTTLIASFLPKREEPLEYHLARTDLFRHNYNTPISKSLEVLRELVTDRQYTEKRDDGRTKDKRNDLRETMYRRSFAGRDDQALTPGGQTINYERIKILAEKKSLLIKLLLDDQTELEDRIESLIIRSESTNGEATNAVDLEDVNSVKVPDWETLASEEATLRTILLRNQELEKFFDAKGPKETTS